MDGLRQSYSNNQKIWKHLTSFRKSVEDTFGLMSMIIGSIEAGTVKRGANNGK